MGKRKTREIYTGLPLQIIEGRRCHPFPSVNTEDFKELLGCVSPNLELKGQEIVKDLGIKQE